MTREVAAKDALLCRNLADEGILQSDVPIPNDKPKEECGVFGISLSPPTPTEPQMRPIWLSLRCSIEARNPVASQPHMRG